MKSLSRALTLLAAVSALEPATLADLSDSVGLHKSTVHRMLATFMSHGLVSRDETNRYRVGPQARVLAETADRHADSRQVIEAALTRLESEVGEAAFYAVPGGLAMRCVAVASGRGPAAERVVGPRTALFHTSALGKAYLAFRPRDEVDAYASTAPFPAQTPFSVTDVSTFARVLRTVRRRGWATEDRESHPLARRLGAAVLDPRGNAVAAVAVDVPAGAYGDGAEGLSRPVLACVAEIEDGFFGRAYPRSMPERLGTGAVKGGQPCLRT